MSTGFVDLSGAKILVVDDTPSNLDLLSDALEAAGYEVCRRLKADAATRDIPVVYITAHSQAEEIVQGFESGGVDYILKPFRKEEVLVRVRTHLENARLAQTLAEQNEALEQRNQDLVLTNKALQDEMARRQAVTSERDRLAERLSELSSREAERWGIAGFVGRSGTLQTILKSVDTLQGAGVCRR